MNKKNWLLISLIAISAVNIIAEDETQSSEPKPELVATETSKKKILSSILLGGLTGIASGYITGMLHQNPLFNNTFDIVFFPTATISNFTFEMLIRSDLINKIADRPVSIKGTSRERRKLGNIAWISSWIGFMGSLVTQAYR